MTRVTDTGTVTPRRITCSGCDAVWTAMSAAHCAGCHRTLAGSTLFDRHRHARGDHGSCLDPATLLGPTGDRIMFFRDGMWRGPEASDELKASWRTLAAHRDA
jgi:hypothetical protein